MSSNEDKPPKVVYWHRELPPLGAEPMHEHVIEATSNRVSGIIEQHGELWQRCYAVLTENTQLRLEQEVTRLGGDYSFFFKEPADPQNLPSSPTRRLPD